MLGCLTSVLLLLSHGLHDACIEALPTNLSPGHDTPSTLTSQDHHLQAACTLGSYSSNGACFPCHFGTYASSAGFCSDCPPGYFGNTRGALSCQKCPVGTNTVSSGTRVCTATPPTRAPTVKAVTPAPSAAAVTPAPSAAAVTPAPSAAAVTPAPSAAAVTPVIPAPSAAAVTPAPSFKRPIVSPTGMPFTYITASTSSTHPTMHQPRLIYLITSAIVLLVLS